MRRRPKLLAWAIAVWPAAAAGCGVLSGLDTLDFDGGGGGGVASTGHPHGSAGPGGAGGAHAAGGGGVGGVGGSTGTTSPVASSSSGGTSGKCPTVMLVLDETGSMVDPANGVSGATKWELLGQGVQRLLALYPDRARYGLELFGAMSGVSDAACYSDTHIDVTPAAGTAATIASDVQQAMPIFSSNVGEAVERAAADPTMADPTHPPYEILITDGDPNCNSLDVSSDGSFTIGQVTAAAARMPSVHTFVIGLDKGTFDMVLNEMAAEGLESQAGCGPTPCYYPATTQQNLDAAIDAVIDEIGVAGCDPN